MPNGQGELHVAPPLDEELQAVNDSWERETERGVSTTQVV